MKNKKGLFVALLVVISAFAIYQFGLEGSTVAAYSVTKQDYVPSLIISGEVIPETSASISTQTGGIVMQCLAKKGEVVKQGQLLVQLDDRQAQINLDRARQTVQMAQLNLQQAATVTMEGMRLTSIQADLDLEQA
ncbi:MAG: biotin/lipoyl-binding protein, partial [Firmicutes bacterium]|nr:biotin/lipoyl-binding protein [Bacillota bacterium]